MFKTYSKWHRTKRKLYIALTVFAFLCICGTIYYKTQELKKQEIKVQYELNKAQEKYDEEEERTAQIEEHKAYVQTKKYAEEVARDKFGMVYKDEIIFTPKSVGDKELSGKKEIAEDANSGDSADDSAKTDETADGNSEN